MKQQMKSWKHVGFCFLLVCSFWACAEKSSKAPTDPTSPQSAPSPEPQIIVNSPSAGQTSKEEIAAIKEEIKQVTPPVESEPQAKATQQAEATQKKEDVDVTLALRTELSKAGWELDRETAEKYPTLGVFLKHLIQDTFLDRSKAPLTVKVTSFESSTLAYADIEDGKTVISIGENALEESFVGQLVKTDMNSPLRFTNRLYFRLIEIAASPEALVAVLKKQYSIEVEAGLLNASSLLSLYQVLLDLPPSLLKIAAITRVTAPDEEKKLEWYSQCESDAKNHRVVCSKENQYDGFDRERWLNAIVSSVLEQLPKPFWMDYARLLDANGISFNEAYRFKNSVLSYLTDSEKLKKESPVEFNFFKDKLFAGTEYLRDVEARAKVFVPSVQEDITPPALPAGVESIDAIAEVKQSRTWNGNIRVTFQVPELVENGSGVAGFQANLNPDGFSFDGGLRFTEIKLSKKGKGYFGSVILDPAQILPNTSCDVSFNISDNAGNRTGFYLSQKIIFEGTLKPKPVVAEKPDTRMERPDPGLVAKYGQITVKPYAKGRFGGKLGYRVILPIQSQPDSITLNWGSSTGSEDLKRSGVSDQGFSHWASAPNLFMKTVGKAISWAINNERQRYVRLKEGIAMDVVFPDNLVGRQVTLNQVILRYYDNDQYQYKSFKIDSPKPELITVEPESEKARFRIIDRALSLKVQHWDQQGAKNPKGGEKTIWVEFPVTDVHQAKDMNSFGLKMRDPSGKIHEIVIDGYDWRAERESWTPTLKEVVMEHNAAGDLWIRVPIHLMTHNLQGEYALESLAAARDLSGKGHFYGASPDGSTQTTSVDFVKRNIIQTVKVQ